jgi:hypothetical protein
MNLPGFSAEASVYKTSGRYYIAWAATGARGGIEPAQQFCPPWCIQDCIAGCRADGNSPGFCGGLCSRECNAYGSGKPASCGPCVQNVQTCILCGGVTTTRSCDLAVCGNTVCSPGAQCCGPHCCPPTCCPAGTQCCSDGDGCCADGSICASFLGIKFCLPWIGQLNGQDSSQISAIGEARQNYAG